MYKVDDMVMHSGAGVCKIDEIKIEQFSDCKERLYYVLKPVYDKNSTTLFIPVDNSKNNLRKLLSMEKIKELILSIYDDGERLWTDNEKERAETFANVIKSGDHTRIIKLIIEMHEKISQKHELGKKLRQTDEKVLYTAEKMIHEEFAYALKIEPEDVAPYIMKQLNLN